MSLSLNSLFQVRKRVIVEIELILIIPMSATIIEANVTMKIVDLEKKKKERESIHAQAHTHILLMKTDKTDTIIVTNMINTEVVVGLIADEMIEIKVVILIVIDAPVLMIVVSDQNIMTDEKLTNLGKLKNLFTLTFRRTKTKIDSIAHNSQLTLKVMSSSGMDSNGFLVTENSSLLTHVKTLLNRKLKM
jgi:hypothetical protein